MTPMSMKEKQTLISDAEYVFNILMYQGFVLFVMICYFSSLHGGLKLNDLMWMMIIISEHMNEVHFANRYYNLHIFKS